jgi:hypothetical protein
VGRALGDLGHDLDRRRTGADDCDALAGEVVVVVPARGVEDLALEGLDALDLGEPGLRQAAGPADHDVGGEGAGAGRHLPDTVLLVPARVLDRDAEVEPVEDARLPGDVLEVGLDLRLRGERPRPLGVRRERERVELAGHVAGGARVGVVAPGAADGLTLVDHDEVGDAGLVELDRRTETGEAGAEDEHADVVGEGGAHALGHVCHPNRC